MFPLMLKRAPIEPNHEDYDALSDGGACRAQQKAAPNVGGC
jgi:hypothetical protein